MMLTYLILIFLIRNIRVGCYSGASSNGLNSMNLEVRVHGGASAARHNSTRVTWWCLKARM